MIPAPETNQPSCPVPGFHEEVATALEHHSSVTDNVLIVRRFLRHPALPAAHRYRDLHSDGETQQSLAGKLRVLVARAECLVNAECLLRWQTTLEDVQASEEGHESAQVRELCKRVRVKLEAAVSRVVERHTSLDPYLAAGRGFCRFCVCVWGGGGGGERDCVGAHSCTCACVLCVCP